MNNSSGVVVSASQSPALVIGDRAAVYRAMPSVQCDSILPRTLDEVSKVDLSYMNDNWNEEMIRDGMRAIIRVSDKLRDREIDVWDYLSKYSPPENRGFMFSDDPIISMISNKMEVGHSGCSYGWTMRHLELIAKYGLETHRLKYVR